MVEIGLTDLPWQSRHPQGRHTIGQSGKFCKETSPHSQCYQFGIKWYKMHPCGSLEVHQTPRSHNALIDVFKFIRYG